MLWWVHADREGKTKQAREGKGAEGGALPLPARYGKHLMASSSTELVWMAVAAVTSWRCGSCSPAPT